MNDGARDDLSHLLRDLAPHVLGAVVARHREFADSDDAVQDALIAAAAQWPRDGIPENPRGWLYHVALRRITDRLRSEVARRKREDAVATQVWAEWAFVPPPELEVDVQADESLTLVFMCCHPSLTPASAVALTLRAVGGLTTSEIARAFLVPEATMAQRISRAKGTIKTSGVAFAPLSPVERSERLSSVLQVLYLIFNEGYTSSAGDLLQRTDLSSEAIRLTRSLLSLMPDEPEVSGLLALMLLTDSRRSARTGTSGELIPLDEQDRSSWYRAQIDEGIALVSHALPQGNVGSYQLQAAIAAVHAEAARAEDTDWRQILALYEVLERLSDNAMVSLGKAVAIAMVHGPEAGLWAVDAIASRLAGHYRLDAVRAHLYERVGDTALAIAHYTAAAQRTASAPERDYLTLKAIRLSAARR